MTDKSYFKMLGVFEYYAGCNLNINSITSHTVDCGVGRGCYSPVECEGCSIGECIQKAHIMNADGFSYTFGSIFDSKCRLCTNEQFLILRNEWSGIVYKRRGKHI